MLGRYTVLPPIEPRVRKWARAPKRETGNARLSFWLPPTFANGKGRGLMEIAREKPAKVFPAHTLFLAKAVGACVETGCFFIISFLILLIFEFKKS